MKRKYTYSDYETEFIKTHWPIHGSRYVVENLNISQQKLDSFICLNKLKFFRDELSIDMTNKYFCYILGLIWADGTVSIKDKNRVSVKLQSNDAHHIAWIFSKTGEWKQDYAKSKTKNWKDTIRFSKSDKKFKVFLLQNDYNKKSYVSPDKIMTLISTKNLKYFIRGVFDGDGCFVLNNYPKSKRTTRGAFISSTYEQDWKYMATLCTELNCKFSVRKVINNKEKNYKSSVFNISSGDIIRFGNYIYEDFFGLKRKYDKFTAISNSYIYQKWKHD